MGSQSRRKAMLALSAVVVAASLLACGGSEGGEQDGDQKRAALKGTVTVWDWQYSSPTFGKALKQLDQEFEQANPGVTVEHVAQPLDNYDQLVRAAATARKGPDVLMLYPAGQGVFNYQPTLTDLTPYITDEMKRDIIGLDLGAPEYDTENGFFGVPLQTQGNLFYYNKKLFKKAGLDPEQPPTTYDELVDAASKLKAAGIVPFGGGNKEGAESNWWFTALWPGVATREDSIALAAGEISFSDPKVAGTVKRYLDLVEAGYFDDSMPSTPLFPDAVDSFAAGKQAMFLGLASDAASYVQFNEALGTSNVGVFQAPGVDGSKPNFLPVGAGLMWSIPAYSENKDAAAAYIEFTTNARAAETLFEVAGVLPANREAQLTGAAPQAEQILKDFATVPTFSPPHGLWKADVTSDFSRQMQTVIAGDTSLEDALEAVDSTLKRG